MFYSCYCLDLETDYYYCIFIGSDISLLQPHVTSRGDVIKGFASIDANENIILWTVNITYSNFTQNKEAVSAR